MIIDGCRAVEDFDDWAGWLLYRGGVQVKGENSWESWWEEEQVDKEVSVTVLIISKYCEYIFIGRNLAADAYKDAEGSDTGDNSEPKILLIPVWDCL